MPGGIGGYIGDGGGFGDGGGLGDGMAGAGASWMMPAMRNEPVSSRALDTTTIVTIIGVRSAEISAGPKKGCDFVGSTSNSEDAPICTLEVIQPDDAGALETICA